MSIDNRLKHLEDQLLPKPTPPALTPIERLKKIQSILITAASRVSPLATAKAGRLLCVGEELSEGDARKVIGNILLARKLRGVNA